MKDPKPQFSYVSENIKKNHPDFAYVHVVEPRVSGQQDRAVEEGEVSGSSAYVHPRMLTCPDGTKTMSSRMTSSVKYGRQSLSSVRAVSLGTSLSNTQREAISSSLDDNSFPT